MKKIFYLLVSAIVALGAVACQNDIDEQINIEQGNDVFSINVSIDENTRIGMTTEGNNVTYNFVEGDILYVKANNDKTNTFYQFTNSAGALNTFTCNNASALIENLENCGYNATVATRPNAQFDSTLAGIEGLCFLNTNATLNTGNVTLSIEGTIFHFTVPEGTTATLTASSNASSNMFNNNGFVSSVNYSAGEYYVQALANTYKLSYSVNSVTVKAVDARKWEANTIYNLGTLSPAELAFVPSNQWKADGARFAAYLFDSTNTWVDMESLDGGASYVAELPEGTWPNVIFCRMNPSTTVNNWDKNNTWSQTADLKYTAGKTYFTVGWNFGAWATNYDEAVVITEATTEYKTKLFLTPNSNWTTANARFAAYFFNDSTNKNSWVSMTKNEAVGAYEVTIPDGTWPKVIFCRMNPSTPENNWNNKWTQTANLDIPTDLKRNFTITAGSWDNGSWGDISEAYIYDYYMVK